MTEQIDELNQYGSEPFHRLDTESEAWHLRFMRFCRLGPTRTLLGFFNIERAEKGLKGAREISGAFERRVTQFDWIARAQAYDRYINRREQGEWEQRRKSFRERELGIAQALIKKAEQMLQFPLAVTNQETTQEGGKTVVHTTILPARWTFSDASRIIDTADKLMRLALEMETEHQAIDATIAGPEDMEEIRRRRWEQIAPMLAALDDDDQTQERPEENNAPGDTE